MWMKENLQLSTCQGVNKKADQHGHHRHRYPIRQALVPHAAVNRDTSFMALERRNRQLCHISWYVPFQDIKAERWDCCWLYTAVTLLMGSHSI